jgi:hypothetical protein
LRYPSLSAVSGAGIEAFWETMQNMTEFEGKIESWYDQLDPLIKVECDKALITFQNRLVVTPSWQTIGDVLVSCLFIVNEDIDDEKSQVNDGNPSGNYNFEELDSNISGKWNINEAINSAEQKKNLSSAQEILDGVKDVKKSKLSDLEISFYSASLGQLKEVIDFLEKLEWIEKIWETRCKRLDFKQQLGSMHHFSTDSRDAKDNFTKVCQLAQSPMRFYFFPTGENVFIVAEDAWSKSSFEWQKFLQEKKDLNRKRLIAERSKEIAERRKAYLEEQVKWLNRIAGKAASANLEQKLNTVIQFASGAVNGAKLAFNLAHEAWVTINEKTTERAEIKARHTLTKNYWKAEKTAIQTEVDSWYAYASYLSCLSSEHWKFGSPTHRPIQIVRWILRCCTFQKEFQQHQMDSESDFITLYNEAKTKTQQLSEADTDLQVQLETIKTLEEAKEENRKKIDELFTNVDHRRLSQESINRLLENDENFDKRLLSQYDQGKEALKRVEQLEIERNSVEDEVELQSQKAQRFIVRSKVLLDTNWKICTEERFLKMVCFVILRTKKSALQNCEERLSAGIQQYVNRYVENQSMKEAFHSTEAWLNKEAERISSRHITDVIRILFFSKYETTWTTALHDLYAESKQYSLDVFDPIRCSRKNFHPIPQKLCFRCRPGLVRTQLHGKASNPEKEQWKEMRSEYTMRLHRIDEPHMELIKLSKDFCKTHPQEAERLRLLQFMERWKPLNVNVDSTFKNALNAAIERIRALWSSWTERNPSMEKDSALQANLQEEQVGIYKDFSFWNGISEELEDIQGKLDRPIPATFSFADVESFAKSIIDRQMDSSQKDARKSEEKANFFCKAKQMELDAMKDAQSELERTKNLTFVELSQVDRARIVVSAVRSIETFSSTVPLSVEEPEFWLHLGELSKIGEKANQKVLEQKRAQRLQEMQKIIFNTETEVINAAALLAEAKSNVATTTQRKISLSFDVMISMMNCFMAKCFELQINFQAVDDEEELDSLNEQSLAVVNDFYECLSTISESSNVTEKELRNAVCSFETIATNAGVQTAKDEKEWNDSIQALANSKFFSYYFNPVLSAKISTKAMVKTASKCFADCVTKSDEVIRREFKYVESPLHGILDGVEVKKLGRLSNLSLSSVMDLAGNASSMKGLILATQMIHKHFESISAQLMARMEYENFSKAVVQREAARKLQLVYESFRASLFTPRVEILNSRQTSQAAVKQEQIAQNKAVESQQIAMKAKEEDEAEKDFSELSSKLEELKATLDNARIKIFTIGAGRQNSSFETMLV